MYNYEYTKFALLNLYVSNCYEYNCQAVLFLKILIYILHAKQKMDSNQSSLN